MKQNFIDDLPRALSLGTPYTDGVCRVNPQLNFVPLSVGNIVLSDGDFYSVEADINSDTVFSFEFNAYSDAVDVIFRPVAFVADSGLGVSDVITMDSFRAGSCMTEARYIDVGRYLYSTSGKVVVPFTPLETGKSYYVGLNVIASTDATLPGLGSYSIRLHTKDIASFDPLKA